MRNDTRPPPAFRYGKQQKSGGGLGTRLYETPYQILPEEAAANISDTNCMYRVYVLKLYAEWINLVKVGLCHSEDISCETVL